MQYALHVSLEASQNIAFYEIEQFKMGINDVGGLLDTIKTHSHEFKPLFTELPKKFSRESFKAIYEIEWSLKGSNNRIKEDEAIYCWEIFLNKIEDNEMFYQTEVKSIIVHFEHLLQFTTGSESTPPTGFENSLTITFYDQEDGQTRYPYTSTCAMSLALPRGHEDPTMFEELFLRSLFDSAR
ncbi:uncharacterized protein LOC124449400 isoform X2 [Xenia sp. Carnegie-2017]|uniref:uncharacterized protein LOC124449400 isoform X2 n=1 Tax=Xenia sp. Carnegie-2017 TaxID=2897299 RepID=UPI001F049FDD|nr:uncharacterized protein LOC124449400 isoform X2 [Xenia sp. Carnegie-2017]